MLTCCKHPFSGYLHQIDSNSCSHFSSQSLKHLAKWIWIRTFFSLSVIESSWNIQTNLSTNTMKIGPHNWKRKYPIPFDIYVIRGSSRRKITEWLRQHFPSGYFVPFTWTHSCNSHHKLNKMHVIIPPLTEEKAEVQCVEVNIVIMTSVNSEVRKPGFKYQLCRSLVVWPWASDFVQSIQLCPGQFINIY